MIAVFQFSLKIPQLKLKLTICIIVGKTTGNISLSTCVGMVSNSHDFVFMFLIISSICLLVSGANMLSSGIPSFTVGL